MDLNKLLRPGKIAVVGASEKENLGGFTVRMILNHARERLKDVYWVNPGRDQVFGMKCYRSLAELPEEIDLAIIATAKNTVEALLREASRKGAGGAVVFASGYGETGKAEDLEAERSLVQLCGKLDIALMGPNCAGYMNFADRVLAMGFLTTVRKEAGKVGLVSQSGMICTLLLDSAKTEFSYVISCGNSKAVGVVDYMDFLIDDDHTKVIAAYIEGVKDPASFARVLEKAALKGKPIVLLKIGSSEAGSRSAASHTGSLSGSDKVFDAIFDKFGVIRVDDLEDLASMTNMLATLPALPRRNSIISVNGAGGETGIAADAGARYGLSYPQFSVETVEKLKAVLPGYASVRNPLDTTATPAYDAESFSKVLEIAGDDPGAELIMVSITVVEEITDTCVAHMSDGIVDYVKRRGCRKPIVVVPAIEAGRLRSVVDKLKEVGVPVLPPVTYAYKHIGMLLKYAEWVRTMDRRTLKLAIPQRTGGSPRALSEHDSKKLLARYGIPVPEETIAPDRESAAEAAEKIGFPVVMKVESADIPHKSDAGGVELDIATAEQAREAYDRIIINCKAYKPEAKINGILVQKMLPKGTEAIIGVNCDPMFGPMILLGMGGVFVDVFRDVVLYPAPLNRWEAGRMIRSLRCAKLFRGYRGAPPLDTAAVEEALLALSEFAVENIDKVSEADINPLFVYPEGSGAAAADSLIVMKE